MVMEDLGRCGDYLVSDARTITEHIVSDIEREPNIDPNSIGRVEEDWECRHIVADLLEILIS